MRRAISEPEPASPRTAVLEADALAGLDTPALQRQFAADGEFLFLDDFLPQPLVERLQAQVAALDDAVHRNFIPRHKKGGSVSRYTINERAPEIAALYRDRRLLEWLEALSGERLQPCPEADAHAYALYYYTEAGDHIGWHYDTSYYHGKRYTLLLGIDDDSSCRLEYELFRDNAARESVHGARALRPGALCFFNGDAVWHRITPLGEGERRVSLTFEYVTDARMGRWQRFVSNMKDSIAYFGFRQAFARSRR